MTIISNALRKSAGRPVAQLVSRQRLRAMANHDQQQPERVRSAGSQGRLRDGASRDERRMQSGGGET